MPILLRIPHHYTKKLPPQHKIHIHSMISDFNIVENVLCRMNAGLIVYETTRALASYLEWILKESEVCLYTPFLLLKTFLICIVSV